MPRKSLLFYLCCSFFSIDEIIAVISAPSCHVCPRSSFRWSGCQKRVVDFSERQSFVSIGNAQNLKASTLFVCSWRTKPLHGNCPVSVRIIKYPVTGIPRDSSRRAYSIQINKAAFFFSGGKNYFQFQIASLFGEMLKCTHSEFRSIVVC